MIIGNGQPLAARPKRHIQLVLRDIYTDKGSRRHLHSSQSQPFLARYGLAVRATVRACDLNLATATTFATLSHGLLGPGRGSVCRPPKLSAIITLRSLEACRDRRRWPGKE